MQESQKRTILIVDDTPEKLDELIKLLTEYGFKIFLAKNGEIAIKEAEYGQPDIILLDVIMRGIDGFETCRRLKKNELTKNIPVIFMTVISQTENKVVAFEIGGVDYVTKPLQYEEVLARINTHLNIQNLQNKLLEKNKILEKEICDRIAAEQEIKQLNEDLKRRAAQLEATNKELEAFSYSVSHDLRNPLLAIDGFTWSILYKYSSQLDEKAKKYLETIRSTTSQMSKLIDDLLHLSSVTSSEISFTEVDLSQLARKIASSLQISASERVVEFAIADRIVVQGDKILLGVMLENLLGNAWKYTRKNTLARIEFGILDDDSQLPTSNPVYFVRDNGVGFKMANADRIFRPFQRLHHKNEFEGTGIGLATVQRIVHRHGGRIWVEAVPNQGATFYFTLG